VRDSSRRAADPRRIRVLAVAGARPNFMKIAPLMREFLRRERFEPFLVHTGQHYDDAMSEGFFRDLGIPAPDLNLGVGSGSHGAQTAEVLSGIEAVLIREKPDAVLVVGDVNSTLAATLAAVKLDIPVAHVEAGLRSGDRSMPEEINRLMTDVVSQWLFTTESSGQRNLLREGVPAERIHDVGNVMIDTLLSNLERAQELDTLEGLKLEAREYAVLTLHRPSNVDDPDKLRALFRVLEEIHAQLPVVFPAHPRTKAAVREFIGKEPGLLMIEPLGYLEFLQLMANARLVLTDSGGVQEETTALGITWILGASTPSVSMVYSRTAEELETKPAVRRFSNLRSMSSRRVCQYPRPMFLRLDTTGTRETHPPKVPRIFPSRNMVTMSCHL